MLVMGSTDSSFTNFVDNLISYLFGYHSCVCEFLHWKHNNSNNSIHTFKGSQILQV